MSIGLKEPQRNSFFTKNVTLIVMVVKPSTMLPLVAELANRDLIPVRIIYGSPFRYDALFQTDQLPAIKEVLAAFNVAEQTD